MFPTLLTVAGLFLAGTGDSGTEKPAIPAVRAEYEAKNAQVGRDAQAHVRLALWCEQNGLTAERTRHLALAVLNDPKNALARSLSGLVAYQGSWKRPEAISEKVKADAALGAKLAEYNARREGVRNNADAHWKLALWCEEQGLDAEARAHFTTVVRLDPSRDAAWKKLGCKKVGNRWVTDQQLAAEKAEFEAQKAAEKKWRPLLRKWQSALAGKNDAKRAEAESALETLTDPRAVPAIWAVFAQGDPRWHAKAVEVLGRIEGIPASRALGTLAAFSRDPEVRRAAREILRRRDARETVTWMIAMLRKPIKYEVRRPNGPGSTPVLFVEGERYNLIRDYAARTVSSAGRVFRERSDDMRPRSMTTQLALDALGQPVSFAAWGNSDIFGTAPAFAPTKFVSELEARVSALLPHGSAEANHLAALAANPPPVPAFTSSAPAFMSTFTQFQTPEQVANTVAVVAENRLEGDIQSIESTNSAINDSNARIVGVLTDLTGKDLPPDSAAWTSWWVDQQGYAYSPPTDSPKPTFLQDAGPTNFQVATTLITQHSCFRAGTSVRTLTGPRAIDSLEVGDRVLIQDTTSGEMRFEPVLAVYHNKPAALYNVDLGGESVWATGIHRFWKAGRGWAMARDLKPGDTVRTLGGTQTVRSVEEGPVEPVFNLEVGGGQSFFVGKLGALVHDNSLVLPVAAPFDADSPRSPQGK